MQELTQCSLKPLRPCSIGILVNSRVFLQLTSLTKNRRSARIYKHYHTLIMDSLSLNQLPLALTQLFTKSHWGFLQANLTLKLRLQLMLTRGLVGNQSKEILNFSRELIERVMHSILIL